MDESGDWPIGPTDVGCWPVPHWDTGRCEVHSPGRGRPACCERQLPIWPEPPFAALL